MTWDRFIPSLIGFESCGSLKYESVLASWSKTNHRFFHVNWLINFDSPFGLKLKKDFMQNNAKFKKMISWQNDWNLRNWKRNSIWDFWKLRIQKKKIKIMESMHFWFVIITHFRQPSFLWFGKCLNTLHRSWTLARHFCTWFPTKMNYEKVSFCDLFSFNYFKSWQEFKICSIS